MNPIDSITEIADRDGFAALPALTQADLCGLGAADKALVCQRTWDWWLGLGEQGRERAAAKSLEFLASRELIVPVHGDVPAVPAPELGLILAARSNPEPLVLCQVPGVDSALYPRFFGMTEEGTGLRVLVCERLTERSLAPGTQSDFGTMLTYALMTPFWVGKMLAAWARAVCSLAPSESPVVDVYARGEDGQLDRARYEVRCDGKLFEISRPALAIPSERLDEMQVARKLALALIGAVR